MPVSGPDLLPDYADLAATLQRCGLAQGPAEVQGLALGLFVAAVDAPLTLWHRELYSDLDPADVSGGECKVALDRLFASVFADPAAGPLQLTLLLPPDIEVNTERLKALRDWCQGFLFGFGLGGGALSGRLSGQTRELLHDIAEFTRLDTGDVDDNPANREALIEVEEYLREAVMLIRDELINGRAKDEPS